MERPVVRLREEWLDEVVDTLCDACAGYRAQLGQLIGYFTDSRFSRGWPVLGVVQGDRLLAAANLNPPRKSPPPPSLQRRYDRLREQLGEPAADPDSNGVVLTTEAKDNLPLYDHFGYRILGRAQVDKLESWTLFRPDDSQEPGRNPGETG